MSRKPNTDQNGYYFQEQTKLAVWNKAQVVPGVNPLQQRKDICGAFIDWNQYGVTTENSTGWEIDHIRPVSTGGGDELGNL